MKWLVPLLAPLLSLAGIVQGQLGTTQCDIKTASFQGRLYSPNLAIKNVSVLIIGGSEGHLFLADEIGPQLAAAGYETLGVEYQSGFDAGQRLDLIPIEIFIQAVHWLKTMDSNPHAVVVMGDSRGSEAALLTALHSPEVAGVAAFVPSSVLWGAVDNTNTKQRAAWSLAGKPLPCANCANQRGSFTEMLDHVGPENTARVEVEHIHGPVFLAGSDADAVWPSARMAREIAARLARFHFAYPITLMTFPDASHQLWGLGPKNPIQTYQYPGGTYTSNAGGSATATEAARNTTWAAMLVYLEAIVADQQTAH